MNTNYIWVAITTVLLIGTLTGGVVAQESNATDSNPDNSSVMAITSSVSLQDYEFTDGQIRLTLHADYSQNVKIVDAYGGTQSEGASQIQGKEILLDSGENTLSMDVTTFKGIRGVSVSAGGGGITISDYADSGPTFTTTFTSQTAIILMIVSMATGVGLVLGVAYYKEIRYSSVIKQEL